MHITLLNRKAQYIYIDEMLLPILTNRGHAFIITHRSAAYSTAG